MWISYTIRNNTRVGTSRKENIKLKIGFESLIKALDDEIIVSISYDLSNFSPELIALEYSDDFIKR